MLHHYIASVILPWADGSAQVIWFENVPPKRVKIVPNVQHKRSQALFFQSRTNADTQRAAAIGCSELPALSRLSIQLFTAPRGLLSPGAKYLAALPPRNRGISRNAEFISLDYHLRLVRGAYGG